MFRHGHYYHAYLVYPSLDAISPITAINHMWSLFFSIFPNTKFFATYYGTVDEKHVLYIGRCGADPMLILKEVISTRITQILAEKSSSFVIPRVLQIHYSFCWNTCQCFFSFCQGKKCSQLIRYCKNTVTNVKLREKVQQKQIFPIRIVTIGELSHQASENEIPVLLF